MYLLIICLLSPFTYSVLLYHSHSHILKVPFENSGGSGIVYIWIGSQTTQEQAIHAEQMGRTMFEVGMLVLRCVLLHIVPFSDFVTELECVYMLMYLYILFGGNRYPPPPTHTHTHTDIIISI